MDCIRKTVAARNQRRAAPSSNPQQNGPATNQSRLAINQLDDRAGGLNNNHPNQPHGSTPALSSNASPRPATVRENRKTETNLAVVLIGITTMHLICHALRVFLATYAVYLNTTWVNCMKTQNSYAPPLWTMCAEHISSIMIMINLAGNFLIYCSVLKPFKAYLVERCGSSVWLKLFRRINEYITSRRRRGGNNNAPDIIMTTPPPNTVQIRQIGNNMETENKTVFTPTPIQDTEASHLKNKLNGDKVNEEDDPLINNTVSSIHANELSTPNEKPQTSRPRGRGSSVRLEKKKILAKAGRGLSFLSHFSKKANDKVNEDNLEQGNSNSTRSERIKSEGDIKITKGKNNITVGKKCTLISDSTNDNEAEATMLTQVIEHDHNEDAHGMQQFMVESEGGTVLIDCTNVTIVKADQTANKPYHLYENQNCGSTHDVCSQKAPDSTRQNRKADKKDGFSQT